MAKPFVHLHLHTEYSLLDGAIKVGELPRLIREKGMDAVAITDHGSMYGVVDFYRACKEEGIKPIIGCEVYVADDRHYRKPDDQRYHLILLAETEGGYHNLVKICSTGYTEGFYYKPRVDKEVLQKYREGIICTSACMAGEVPTMIRRDNYEGALKAALEYQEIFGKGNFFIEIQDHKLPEDKALNAQLIRLSGETGIPLVAANDAHYGNREDAFSHEVLMCIQMGKTIKDEHRMEFPNSEFYVKTPQEMEELFGGIPEAMENTVRIMERCNVDFSFGENRLPSYVVPEGETLESYLRALCLEGARNKYGAVEGPVLERLEYELGVIGKMGYPGYFLIVWDMIHFAKDHDIYVGPGRGSAAGSIVAYVLDITAIDPLKYDLLFERFLNPERISLPDIDTDFCFVRRGEVIEYLVEKYGKDRVAQIVTFGTMAARAAIRDVGRALDIPLKDVDKAAKLVPEELKITLESAMAKSPELAAFAVEREDISQLLDIARRLEGMPRHASTHAAAVVISPGPLDNFLPIKVETEGNLTTQFTMNTVEDLGLLKMDLLGLRTLTVIGDTVKKIRENRGLDIDIDKIPLDDPRTYELLGTGKTSGLFQLESGGMQAIIRNLKPDSIDDIIALVALYRPGPIGSGMIDDYIKRKHGQVEVTYLHPILEPILKDTYGVILYQEQVMKIARDMGGFTLGQADNLRKAMGKKKPEILEKNRQHFLDGSRENGIDEHQAERVFELIEHFAGYGFNKSHSAAYGILAYQTAYLKANYQEEFMASLLSSVIMQTDKMHLYIDDCRQIGIKVMPPDVNWSMEDFSVKDNTIRFGLSAIRNIGFNSITSIIQARKEGVFQDIDDFCARVDLRSTGKKVIENLAYSGAFASMGYPRKGLLQVLDKAYDRGASFQRDQHSDQVSLFDLGGEILTVADSTQVGEEEFPMAELLAKEKEMLGFYISSHPLELHEELKGVEGFYDIIDLESGDDGRRVALKGVIGGLKERRTKNNEVMATCTIEDEVGSLEVVVFPNLYKEAYGLLKEGSVVLLGGRLAFTERDNKLIAEKAVAPANWMELKSYLKGKVQRTAGNGTQGPESTSPRASVVKEDGAGGLVSTIRLQVNEAMGSKERLGELKTLLLAHRGSVLVELEIDGKEYRLGATYGIRYDENMKKALEAFGEVTTQ